MSEIEVLIEEIISFGLSSLRKLKDESIEFGDNIDYKGVEDNVLRCLKSILNYLVDTKNGGWFTSVNDAGVAGRGDKGGFWVCPYHNGRMCLEIMERVPASH